MHVEVAGRALRWFNPRLAEQVVQVARSTGHRPVGTFQLEAGGDVVIEGHVRIHRDPSFGRVTRQARKVLG